MAKTASELIKKLFPKFMAENELKVILVPKQRRERRKNIWGTYDTEGLWEPTDRIETVRKA